MLPPPDGAEEVQAEALEGFFGQRLQKKNTTDGADSRDCTQDQEQNHLQNND